MWCLSHKQPLSLEISSSCKPAAPLSRTVGDQSRSGRRPRILTVLLATYDDVPHEPFQTYISVTGAALARFPSQFPLCDLGRILTSSEVPVSRP